MLVKDAHILINAIKEAGYKENPFEKSLINTILYTNRRTLSYKQGKALEAIYAKSQGAGVYARKEYISESDSLLIYSGGYSEKKQLHKLHHRPLQNLLIPGIFKYTSAEIET